MLFEKIKEEIREFINRAIKNLAQSVIAKHRKSLSDDKHLKEAWLKCAIALFEDFEKNHSKNKGHSLGKECSEKI